ARRQRFGRTLHAKGDVPAARFPLDGDRLHRAEQGTMQLHLDRANRLQAQTARVEQSAPVAVTRKGQRVVPALRLEARRARRLPSFRAAEEGRERLIDAPQHVLARGEVRQVQCPAARIARNWLAWS